MDHSINDIMAWRYNMEALLIGLLFAIGFIWPIQKLSRTTRRKLNGYAFSVDIAVGSAMAWFFFGTQGGMIIATVATVMFTAYMSLSSISIGAEHLTLRGWKDVQHD